MKFVKKPIILFLLLSFITLSACTNEESGKTIYMFRHAEKELTTKTDNPPLTDEGERQAVQISNILKEVGLEEIYTTKYIRNLSTVKPLIDSTGVPVKYYKWEAWEEVVDQIKKSDAKVIALCGHGDILLPMIEKLGGVRPQETIEKDEYKKIYNLLLLGNDVTVQTIKF